MCFSTPTRCSVISNLSQTSVWSRRAPCTYAFPGLQRAGQWEESSEVKIESGIALWFLGRAQQEEAGPNITPTHIPVVSSLWRWFWISPGLGCNRDLKSEKRGCFWSSTRQQWILNERRFCSSSPIRPDYTSLLASSSDLFVDLLPFLYLLNSIKRNANDVFTRHPQNPQCNSGVRS